MMAAAYNFTVRVYGILYHERKVLLSHEQINGFAFTKFPGGGVEFGEGLKEALIREYKEETGLDIMVADHVYTCDFFVESRFEPGTQVIGVYYKVKELDEEQFRKMPEGKVPHKFGEKENSLLLVWIPEENVKDVLTFDMDKAAWKNFTALSKDIYPA